MTDETEKALGALCLRAGDDALRAVGTICAGQGAGIAHIVLMSAASTLMAVAAQTLVRDKTGQQPAPTDPEVVKIYRYWIREMDRFPDTRAIAMQLTAIREEYYLGMIVEPPPSAGDMLVFMQQVAGMRDPLASDGPSNDDREQDHVETLSTIIRSAKSIVGDYSVEEDGDGD